MSKLNLIKYPAADVFSFISESTVGPGARPKVSLVIPTLNEAKNLPLILPYVPMNWVDEVVLVDGHSSDNTVEVARQLMPSIRVVMETKKGKGAAMRTGYKVSTGDIIIVIDADGSHDPREIPRYIMPLLEGADFVKGSRFAPGGGTTDMPRIRKLGNWGFVTLSNFLFSQSFTDLCYGFHAFWRYCLDSIHLEKADGFEIDSALYLQAVKARLRIVEVPSFEGYRFHGVGKLQTVPDGTRVLRTIFYQWLTSLRRNEDEAFLGFRGGKQAYAGFHVASPLLESAPANDQNLNLQFLQLLSLMVIARADMRYVLGRVLQMTLTELDAASGSIILLDEKGAVREGCLAYNGETNYTDTWSEMVQQGLAGWVIKNHEPALIENTLTDPRWVKREWDDKKETSRSVVAIPLSVGEKVVGVLTLARPAEKKFSTNELDVLLEYVLKYLK